MSKDDLTAQGTKQKYRKKADLPHPGLDHRAEKNRLKKQFKLRVDPELLEQVTKAAKAQGKSRQKWAEDAFKAALEK